MADSMQLAIDFSTTVSQVKKKTEGKIFFNFQTWEYEPYEIKFGTNHPLQYHVLSHTNGFSENIHHVKYMRFENEKIARIKLLGDLIGLRESDFYFQIDCWLQQLNRLVISSALNDVQTRTKSIINPVLEYFGIELIKPCDFYSQYFNENKTWIIYKKRFISNQYSPNEVSYRLNLRSNIKLAYWSCDGEFVQGNSGKCDYCGEPYQNLQKIGGYGVCLHCIDNFGHKSYLKCDCANYFCFNESIYIFNQTFVFLIAPHAYELSTGLLVESDYKCILGQMIDPSYFQDF